MDDFKYCMTRWRKELLYLLFNLDATVGLKSFSRIGTDEFGWIEIRLNGKYLYVCISITELYYCVQCDERREHEKNSQFIRFNLEQDKIWCAKQIQCDLVPDEILLDHIGKGEYKEKYGMSYYDLENHLYCFIGGFLK